MACIWPTLTALPKPEVGRKCMVNESISAGKHINDDAREIVVTPNTEDIPPSFDISKLSPFLSSVLNFDNDEMASPTLVQNENMSNIKENCLQFDLKITSENAFKSQEVIHPIPRNITSYYSMYLDEEGMQYIQYYQETYSKYISIGVESSNYFLHTFLKLANLNEAILYSLTSWGGLFLEGTSNSCYKHKSIFYMQRSIKLIRAQYEDMKPKNKNDFFVLFCFYLIIIGWKVCSGDVEHWYTSFYQCYRMIVEFGGLRKICQEFNHTNDIKWLVSDFQFHDLMSSTSFMGGTVFPIEEYKNVLREDSSYGLDPLQGSLQPIYMILGEITNYSVIIRNKLDCLKKNEYSYDSLQLNDLRTELYQEIEIRHNQFNILIDTCCPYNSNVNLLINNPQELELQMTLFELYSYVCKIHLNMYLKMLPPSSIEQQLLLMKCLRCIDCLIDSRLVVALSMLLLICGTLCCTERDRIDMGKRFKHILKSYEVGNFPKVIETVEDFWIKNPRGIECIDWAEIVQEKEWVLYVG